MQKPITEFLIYDGCPDSSVIERDSDFDGISDFLDACPLEPETFNMFFDDDGCPDSIDTIVLHLHSQMLTVTESMTEWMHALMRLKTLTDTLDWDGCPDVYAESTIPISLDSDGDGYPDAIDSCPNTTETWNKKYNDHDGCPDIAPEQQRFVHDDDLDDIINDEDGNVSF